MNNQKNAKGPSQTVREDSELEAILAKIFGKWPPYMGHNGMVEDEEFNHYTLPELREELLNWRATEVAKATREARERVLSLESLESKFTAEEIANAKNSDDKYVQRTIGGEQARKRIRAEIEEALS